MSDITFPLRAADTVQVSRAGKKSDVGVPKLASAPVDVRRITDAAYMLRTDDCGKALAFTNGAAVTVPAELGQGFICTFIARGAAGITVAAGGGATVSARNGGAAIAQYGVGGILADDDSAYILFGDVTAP